MSFRSTEIDLIKIRKNILILKKAETLLRLFAAYSTFLNAL